MKEPKMDQIERRSTLGRVGALGVLMLICVGSRALAQVSPVQPTPALADKLTGIHWRGISGKTALLTLHIQWQPPLACTVEAAVVDLTLNGQVWLAQALATPEVPRAGSNLQPASLHLLVTMPDQNLLTRPNGPYRFKALVRLNDGQVQVIEDIGPKVRVFK